MVYILIYILYFIIFQSIGSVKTIGLTVLSLIPKRTLKEFDFSKISKTSKIICLGTLDFNKKFKEKIKAELHTIDTADDFENINVTDEDYTSIDSIFSISQKDTVTSDYIIINLVKPTVYEIKYLHETLFFYLPFSEFKKLLIRYKTIVLEINNCELYTLSL